MNDMSTVIIPKSDQISADDLIAGPLTITIEGVDIRPGTEQPVAISFAGDGGRPWKPCKSMSRVLVTAWGPDAKAYVGRNVTLYCDPKVKWGGMEVGGIRVSHLSHIERDLVMALTATKGKRTPFMVKPLKKPEQPSAPKRTIRDIVRDKLAAAVTADDVHAVAQMTAVKKALAEAPDDIKEELGAMLTEAMERTAPVDEPSDDVTSEAA